MRKYSAPILAAVALLVAVPVLAAVPAAEEELLLCPATATTAEAPVPEAAPAEEEIDLEIEQAANPKPVPAWCPSNQRCTFFCPDYPDCPIGECVGGWCQYW